MAMPQNQVPQNAQEAVLNLAKALGLEIEIKGEKQENEKRRKPKKLPKVIPSEGIKKILGQPNIKTKSGLKNRAILETLYRAGLRVQELCNLTPADVDIEKGKIYVQLGKNSKDRHIPIGPCLMKWLRRWDEIRPESDYFFCTSKGGQLSQRQIREMCYRLSEKAGVYIQDGKNKIPVSPHKWRHTYATELLSKGIDIRSVQELLGHANLTTTQRYTHINRDELDKKIKALG